MQLRKYLNSSSKLLLITSVLLVSGCATSKTCEIAPPKIISKNIPVQPRPNQLQLQPVQFYAVSQKNLQQFLAKFEKENGDLVFFAISVPDYENLSLNMGELRRYIEQQKSLLVYYEKSVRDDDDEQQP